MYYRKDETTCEDGFAVDGHLITKKNAPASAELISLYRDYHSNDRIVKDARKVINLTTAEDTTLYSSKAVMDQWLADEKALLDAGKTWGSGIASVKKSEGEIEESDVDWVDLSYKSFNFNE